MKNTKYQEESEDVIVFQWSLVPFTEGNFTRTAQDIYPWFDFENDLI